MYQAINHVIEKQQSFLGEVPFTVISLIHNDSAPADFHAGKQVTFYNEEIGLYIGAVKGKDVLTAQVSFNADLSNAVEVIAEADEFVSMPESITAHIRSTCKGYEDVKVSSLSYVVYE